MEYLTGKYKPLKAGKRGRMIRICDLFLEINHWTEGEKVSQFYTEKDGKKAIVLSQSLSGADNNHIYKIRKYQGYLFCSLNIDRLRLLMGEDFEKKLYQYADDNGNLFLFAEQI